MAQWRTSGGNSGQMVDCGGKWSIVAPLGVTRSVCVVKVRGGADVSGHPISPTG